MITRVDELAFRAALAHTGGGRALPYAADLLKVAGEEDFDPLLLVAIMDRESLCGTAGELDQPGPGGKGDHGHGRGLMQLDDRVHGGTLHKDVIADGRWAEPYWNLKTAVVDHLKPDLAFFARHGLEGDAQLRAAVAAYNTGAGNVFKSIRAGVDVDATTAGHNYSADVLSRYAVLAQRYRQAAPSP